LPGTPRASLLPPPRQPPRPRVSLVPPAPVQHPPYSRAPNSVPHSPYAQIQIKNHPLLARLRTCPRQAQTLPRQLPPQIQIQAHHHPRKTIPRQTQKTTNLMASEASEHQQICRPTPRRPRSPQENQTKLLNPYVSNRLNDPLLLASNLNIQTAFGRHPEERSDEGSPSCPRPNAGTETDRGSR
jgi:hypothetical protein